MEIYYRMADRLPYEGGEIKIELEKFQVVKRTPKGAWIIPHVEPGWWQPRNPKKRFVLDGEGRRYAYRRRTSPTCAGRWSRSADLRTRC